MVLDMAWDQFPHERLVDFERMGVRLVFSFRAEFDLPLNADYILSDLVYGAFIATKHLIALGHRKILHLTMETIPAPAPMVVRHIALHQLLEGYRLALAEAGLEEEEMVLRETRDQELNHARLRSLLSGPGRPTAILASEDYRFLKNYPTIRALGLRIPDDLAVVGFYDTPHCLLSEVPLTSVSVNVAEIARLTAETVIRSAMQRRRIMVNPELVVRESCGGAKATTGKP
jgi:DNA-binding LacI/PurR family transcriptional regulator